MKNVLMLCMALLTFGCATSVEHYQQDTPKLILEEYFDGEIHAWGMVQNFQEEVTRRFTVRIVARWQGNRGTLDEYFQFHDGEQQFRQWRITKTADGRYRGEADDVIGQAEGFAAGNALQWRYVLRVPVDDSEYDITFDDWMFLLDEKRLFNKAEMRKFGITVGQVTLFFEKQAPADALGQTK